MLKKVEELFLSLKKPNFLTMKLLNQVFNRMSVVDDTSKIIVGNIDVLGQYNLILDGDIGADNYVESDEDLSKIVIFLSLCCNEVDAAHEVGHVLLDVFDRNNRPEEFDEVLGNIQQRLLGRKEEINKMLQGFSDEAYGEYLEHEDEFYQWLQLNPDVRKEYFRRNPEAIEEDFEEEVRVNFFANYVTFNNNTTNYNKIANIIDSIFFNDGNFFLSFGLDEYFPVLSMHDDDDFDNAPGGRMQASFEEQFADYVSLRLYGDELGYANEVLHDILGEEWFVMMDKYYEKIAGKMQDKGKVFSKKQTTN